MPTPTGTNKNRPHVLYCQGCAEEEDGQGAIQGVKTALPFSIVFWIVLGGLLYWLFKG